LQKGPSIFFGSFRANDSDELFLKGFQMIEFIDGPEPKT